MRQDRTFFVVSHQQGENNEEILIRMESEDGDNISITVKNETASQFPVNSKVRVTVEAIQ